MNSILKNTQLAPGEKANLERPSVFSKEELDFLEKYKEKLELLSIGAIKARTTKQRDFQCFVRPYLIDHQSVRRSWWPDNFETKVWEKVLLSEEYYNEIKDDKKLLEARNYFVSYHIKHFDIRDFSHELKVCLKAFTRGNRDAYKWLEVFIDYELDKYKTDNYVQSLFVNDKIGEKVYSDEGEYMVAYDGLISTNFELSEEYLKLELVCKEIEIEMKLSARKKYSKEEHIEIMHLKDYDFSMDYGLFGKRALI